MKCTVVAQHALRVILAALVLRRSLDKLPTYSNPRYKLIRSDARTCAVALRVILATLVLRRSLGKLPTALSRVIN